MVVGLAQARPANARRAIGAGVAEGAQAADGQAVARRRDRETVHAPVELRQRCQDVFALRVIAGHVGVGNVDFVAIVGAVDPDAVGLFRVEESRVGKEMIYTCRYEGLTASLIKNYIKRS